MKTKLTGASSLLKVGVLAVTLMMAGCQSTPETRIATQADAFAAMPADVQEKIRAGKVEVGFTAEQVTLAKGKPDLVNRRTTAEGEAEIWSYERGRSGLGLGLGIGGGSGGVGGGVGVSSGGRAPEIALRVSLVGGRVTAVEDFSR